MDLTLMNYSSPPWFNELLIWPIFLSIAFLVGMVINQIRCFYYKISGKPNPSPDRSRFFLKAGQIIFSLCTIVSVIAIIFGSKGFYEAIETDHSKMATLDYAILIYKNALMHLILIFTAMASSGLLLLTASLSYLKKDKEEAPGAKQSD